MVRSTLDVKTILVVMIHGVLPRLITKESLYPLNMEIVELDALVLGVFTKILFKQIVI